MTAHRRYRVRVDTTRPDRWRGYRTLGLRSGGVTIKEYETVPLLASDIEHRRRAWLARPGTERLEVEPI